MGGSRGGYVREESRLMSGGCEWRVCGQERAVERCLWGKQSAVEG